MYDGLEPVRVFSVVSVNENSSRVGEHPARNRPLAKLCLSDEMARSLGVERENIRPRDVIGYERNRPFGVRREADRADLDPSQT